MRWACGDAGRLTQSADGFPASRRSATVYLRALAETRVVGVGFNLVQACATHERMLEDAALLVLPLGWHIQVHARACTLIDLADRMAWLPVPVVIDHYAHLSTDPDLSPASTRRSSAYSLPDAAGSSCRRSIPSLGSAT